MRGLILFDNIREDLRRSCLANQGDEQTLGATLRELFNPGTQAVLVHRFGAWTRSIRIPGIRHALAVLHFVLQYVFAWRVGIYIPVRCELGPGFVIHTWAGGLILPACRIGKHVTIIGGGIQFDYETKSIGEECWFAPGTKFVGKIRIGDRVRTAPNAVVQVDMPDDTLAFGNPARVVPIGLWKKVPKQAPADAAHANR
jgi:serine acetyltransferase